MKLPHLANLVLFLLSFQPIFSNANQIERLNHFMKLRRMENRSNSFEFRPKLKLVNLEYSPVYIGSHEGQREADKIDSLPGQPEGVDFDQYSGYVTVDPKAGRALFYYFVESPQDSSNNPLVLWLNGGPGCSSLGYGAMEELGPFRVNSDGKTLYKNDYAWNTVANVLFLESPAGVGFSYSNTSSDYDNAGDKNTATDTYTFLVNWLERFPQYKTRDLYLTGESFAGHYVPQLAYTILTNNQNTNQTIIHLKGIAIGNALIDDNTCTQGNYDYYWTHALNSDETHSAITKNCDYATGKYSLECKSYQNQGDNEYGNIDIYNIYAPNCDSQSPNSRSGSVGDFDPCTDNYVLPYLNLPEVQKAFHVRSTSWDFCTNFAWTDWEPSILPTIHELIASGIRIWVYSGDTDGRVPITSSRYAISTFKLPVKTAWQPWYSANEVGGYVVEYNGLVLTTVRGSGHTVPSYQPERALTMISSFLKGNLPPGRTPQ